MKCASAHPGEYVEKQLCRDAILPMPVICEVPCPKDCALSPWTTWSHCSHTCSGKNTEGKQMRARSILAYNAGEGTNSHDITHKKDMGKFAFMEVNSLQQVCHSVFLCSDSQGCSVGHCDAG